MSINIASEIVHFAGHIAGSPTPAAGTIYLASNADRCSVSSVWACVSVRGLLWAVCLASGTVCAAACRVQSVRVRWGFGLHRRGIWDEPGVGQVSPATTEKIKKTHPTFTNQNPPDCASLQKFQKIQKGPFRSLDCAIIS